jgi:hypothetical protein
MANKQVLKIGPSIISAHVRRRLNRRPGLADTTANITDGPANINNGPANITTGPSNVNHDLANATNHPTGDTPQVVSEKDCSECNLLQSCRLSQNCSTRAKIKLVSFRASLCNRNGEIFKCAHCAVAMLYVEQFWDKPYVRCGTKLVACAQESLWEFSAEICRNSRSFACAFLQATAPPTHDSYYLEI